MCSSEAFLRREEEARTRASRAARPCASSSSTPMLWRPSSTRSSRRVSRRSVAAWRLPRPAQTERQPPVEKAPPRLGRRSRRSAGFTDSRSRWDRRSAPCPERRAAARRRHRTRRRRPSGSSYRFSRSEPAECPARGGSDSVRSRSNIAVAARARGSPARSERKRGPSNHPCQRPVKSRNELAGKGGVRILSDSAG